MSFQNCSAFDVETQVTWQGTAHSLRMVRIAALFVLFHFYFGDLIAIVSQHNNKIAEIILISQN